MRLIDADALLDKLKIRDLPIRLTFEILEAPTIDAVPVVRCRECLKWEKYENTAGCGYCHNKRFRFRYGEYGGTDEHVFEPITEPEFSCMDGQRREDGDA